MCINSLLNSYSLNTQKCKNALTNIFKEVSELDSFVYHIQEPYQYKNRIPGVPKGITTIHDGGSRAAILVSNTLNMWPVPDYTGPDIATGLLRTSNDLYKEVYMTSVYLDYNNKNDNFFPKKFKNLVEFCYSSKKPLIINMDSNCHSVLWGLETNPRGEVLEEFIATNGLSVQNIGHMATFDPGGARKCQTRIDVTLTLNFDDVIDWRVTNMVTFSDHNEIGYKLDFKTEVAKKIIYLHKKMNPSEFNYRIASKLPNIPRKITPEWLEEAASLLGTKIWAAYAQTCPKKYITERSKLPKYWNSEITAARKGARKAFKKYLGCRTDEHWERYLECRNLLNKVTKKAKKASWRAGRASYAFQGSQKLATPSMMSVQI
jgi:hypothetical protein